GGMTNRSLFYRPRPRKEDIRKKRWNVAAIMGKALKRTCMVLGAIMLVWIVFSSLIMLTVFRGSDSAARYSALPDEMVVVLKLARGLTEKPGAPTLTDPFPYRQPTVHQVIAQIDAAARDA